VRAVGELEEALVVDLERDLAVVPALEAVHAEHLAGDHEDEVVVPFDRPG
jgi:hypothetical protein